MYNSVIFSIFTENVITPKKKSLTHEQSLPILPLSASDNHSSAWKSLWVSFFWTFYVSGILSRAGLYDRLLSLSMRFSKFMWHAVVLCSFSLSNTVPLCGCSFFSWRTEDFIRSSVEGHLNFKQHLNLLAGMNNSGAVSIHVQVFVWMHIFISLDIPRSRIAGSVGNSNIWGIPCLFSTEEAPFSVPASSVWEF